MVKTIELREGVEITLANDSLWFEEYRDQFGQDILPTIMPLILAVGNSISALADEAGGLDEIYGWPQRRPRQGIGRSCRRVGKGRQPQRLRAGHGRRI